MPCNEDKIELSLKKAVPHSTHMKKPFPSNLVAKAGPNPIHMKKSSPFNPYDKAVTSNSYEKAVSFNSVENIVPIQLGRKKAVLIQSSRTA
jgi:hypothetical protein